MADKIDKRRARGFVVMIPRVEWSAKTAGGRAFGSEDY